jgi:probable phosphoglycerate mutase
MLRTTQTASAIAGALNVETKDDARLKEIGFGEWEMLEMAVLETDSIDLVAAWRGSLTVRPPGGESILDMQERVWASLNDAIENFRGSTVVLSTHMMPTRAIAAAAMRGSQNVYFNLNTSPGGISIYRFFGMEFAEIFTLNYCAHLSEK